MSLVTIPILHCIEDIIKLYQKHGYQFVNLSEALQDSYYGHAKLDPQDFIPQQTRTALNSNHRGNP